MDIMPKRGSRTRFILLAAFLPVLLACGESAKEEAAPQQSKVVQNTIEFASGSPQLASVVTTSVKPRGDAVTRLNGRIIWDEERTVRVFPPLAGRVLSIAVRPGDTVKAGQALAMVSAPELGQTQAEARKAEQDRALAQKSLARIQELHGAGVAPAKDLQAAQADLARAESELARTAARLALYGARAGTVDQQFALRTPISGVVVERNLNPGQELRPDQASDRAPFVVSDPTRLWFVLDVAEADVGIVKPGEQVTLRSPLLGESSAVGRIVHVADSVDLQSRTVKVRGTVENKDRRLKAEMYVTAEVKTPAASGLVVPAKAVYLRGDRNFVFIETAPRSFTRRPVILGTAFDGSQVILQGVKVDEKVVVDGALLLQRILATAGNR
jgi:cobalt-zinc-cadmium efflux system membrane fusion protein